MNTGMGDWEAASEFLRRAEKGLPEDRWYDGNNGLRAVARGIRERDERLIELSEIIERMIAERRALQKDAMSVGEARAGR